RDRTRGSWPAEFPDANKNEYDLATIKRWLESFLQRFFGFSQFKRSAIPNGPKVSTAGALSPRGDWRAASDSVASVWLDELRANVPGGSERAAHVGALRVPSDRLAQCEREAPVLRRVDAVEVLVDRHRDLRAELRPLCPRHRQQPVEPQAGRYHVA